jgi:DNA-directed RNA polymerase beta' subunit
MGHINLVVPVAHIWYFRSLPNKIGYLLGLPTKKLDLIIYYERYVVIQAGLKEADGIQKMDFLTEEEYLDILDSLPKENQYLDDKDPERFGDYAQIGAEVLSSFLGPKGGPALSRIPKTPQIVDDADKINRLEKFGVRVRLYFGNIGIGSLAHPPVAIKFFSFRRTHHHRDIFGSGVRFNPTTNLITVHSRHNDI